MEERNYRSIKSMNWVDWPPFFYLFSDNPCRRVNKECPISVKKLRTLTNTRKSSSKDFFSLCVSPVIMSVFAQCVCRSLPRSLSHLSCGRAGRQAGRQSLHSISQLFIHSLTHSLTHSVRGNFHSPVSLTLYTSSSPSPSPSLSLIPIPSSFSY